MRSSHLSYFNVLKNSSALLTILLMSSISAPAMAQDVEDITIDTIYVAGSF